MHSLPSPTIVNKSSGIMRWVGHLARVGRKSRHMCGTVWWGSLKERDYMEDLGIDGRIILRLILDK